MCFTKFYKLCPSVLSFDNSIVSMCSVMWGCERHFGILITWNVQEIYAHTCIALFGSRHSDLRHKRKKVVRSFRSHSFLPP